MPTNFLVIVVIEYGGKVFVQRLFDEVGHVVIVFGVCDPRGLEDATEGEVYLIDKLLLLPEDGYRGYNGAVGLYGYHRR